MIRHIPKEQASKRQQLMESVFDEFDHCLHAGLDSRQIAAGVDGETFSGQGMLGKHRKASRKQTPTAEDALTFLLLTVDVEKLYRQAAIGYFATASKNPSAADSQCRMSSHVFCGICLHT